MFNKKWPTYAQDEISAVIKVLESGKVNYWTGNEGKLFEKEYADYLGVNHAIAVANGTNALELCLIALGIGPGDEVILPCRTFLATASCVVQVGAKPVVCDIDLISQNICVDTIKPHVTAKTKAIIAMHNGGWPCDMEAIMAFAKQHNLYVIEDCAQAHGAQINGQPVGSFGHMSAFSFCQDKIITTMGEGGLVATNDRALWKKAWAYKDHGKDYDTVFNKEHPPGFRWLHDSFGSNYRMTEAQAAVGRIQLKKLPEWQGIRQRNAFILRDAFKDLDVFELHEPAATDLHAYYRYYVSVKVDRDRLMAAINAAGVRCLVGNCPEIYREQVFIKAGLAPKERFHNAKVWADCSLCFMVDPIYGEVDMHKMADLVRQVVAEARA